MKLTLINLIFAMVVLCLCCSTSIEQEQNQIKEEKDLYPEFDREKYIEFTEDFNSSTSSFFRYGSTGKVADFTCNMGVESSTEAGTKILSFKIDPEDDPGAGKGPEIISNDVTFYGTYSARLKVPDAREIQPNVGAVVGYFTYRSDIEFGLSEIDFEWLIADPTIIYVGTWTGPRGSLERVGRTINLAEGVIYDTSYRKQDGHDRKNLEGEQNVPVSIDKIEGYDASSRFYTYGFDWYPDRVRWWMIHPVTSDTIVLWDYQSSDVGIPKSSTYYRMNFWHTNNWSVETNPSSLEKPIYPFELEVDWMSYVPMKKQ
jgi:hypothetical protein